VTHARARGLTLVELIVAISIGAVALAIALEAFVSLYTTSGSRVQRAQELSQGLRLMEQVSYDLDRATESESNPLACPNPQELKIAILVDDGGKAGETTVGLQYVPAEGSLMRTQGSGATVRLNASPMDEVTFNCTPVAVPPAAHAVSCLARPGLGGTAPPPGTPAPSRPVLLWTARVVLAPAAGLAPPGWVEPP
jgi:prepilin-type N-terminal cleavage/methylation domain-containing protein